MEIIRGNGYLVDPDSEEQIAAVSYTINLIRPTRDRFGEWSGSLTVKAQQTGDYNLFDHFGDNLTLQLEDGRSGKIILTTPTQFQGTGRFE